MRYEGFLKLAFERRSVRAYADRRVERETLDRLSEAVRIAPSASNQQPWKLVMVDDHGLIERLGRATFGPSPGFNRFAPSAAAIAVLVVERPRLVNRLGAALKGRDFPLIDIGIAASQLCLCAAELGLGTCMLGWFDERAIKRLLKIPRGRRIGLVVTIGYPAGTAPTARKDRKPLELIRSWNEY
jgi:nitroreductase